MTAPADWSSLAAQAEEACKNATPEPWEFDDDSSPHSDSCCCRVTDSDGRTILDTLNQDVRFSLVQQYEDGPWHDEGGKANAQFCAIARTALPAAIAEIARLKVIIEQIGGLAKREHALRLVQSPVVPSEDIIICPCEQSGKCTCGATEHNQRVAALMKEAK